MKLPYIDLYWNKYKWFGFSIVLFPKYLIYSHIQIKIFNRGFGLDWTTRKLFTTLKFVTWNTNISY